MNPLQNNRLHQMLIFQHELHDMSNTIHTKEGNFLISTCQKRSQKRENEFNQFIIINFVVVIQQRQKMISFFSYRFIIIIKVRNRCSVKIIKRFLFIHIIQIGKIIEWVNISHQNEEYRKSCFTHFR